MAGYIGDSKYMKELSIAESKPTCAGFSDGFSLYPSLHTGHTQLISPYCNSSTDFAELLYSSDAQRENRNAARYMTLPDSIEIAKTDIELTK